MIKRFYKIINVIAIFAIFGFVNIASALAAASAKVGFDGPSSAEVNKQITVTMYIDNISGALSGVVSTEGNLVFDSEYLQYISGTGATSPYTFQINESYNYKVAGLDITLANGIKSKTTIMTFVFKPLKAGTTTISFANPVASSSTERFIPTTTSKSITIGAAKNNDATLKSLSVTGGTLTPGFGANTTSYTVNVAEGTTSVTIAAEANDNKATVSGTGSFNLTSDTTNKTVTVTAEDGTTKKNYTITIKKPTTAKNNDATLKSLSVTGGTLTPGFGANTTSYTVNVAEGTTSVTIAAEANDNKATVTGVGAVTLTGDTTTKTVTVTAEDGTTKKNYTLTIKKPTNNNNDDNNGNNGNNNGNNGNNNNNNNNNNKSSDATLRALNVEGYTISPSFDKDTVSYSITVPNTASEVRVNATTNDAKATASVSGNTGLKVGANTITIKVTAEDGSTKDYVINVTKEEAASPVLDSDTTLNSLSISGYSLSPSFNTKTSTYSVTVPSNVNELNISATPSSGKSKTEITGNTNLKTGMNVVKVKVIAENGATSTYTINVNKKAATSTNTASNPSKSKDNYLKSLSIGELAVLTPTFDKDVSNYNVVVPYEVNKLDLDYVLNDKKANAKIKGNNNFQVGKENIIEIEVTAEDGSVRVYTLNVTREAAVSETDLMKLLVNGYDLNPAFDADVLKYSVTVDYKTDKLDIVAIAKNQDAKVEILKNNNLKVGKNTILIKVTDKNNYVKYYEIEAIKEAKAAVTILGMNPILFSLLFFILLALLVSSIIYLLARMKNITPIKLKEEKNSAPTIEFKPEFNINSKNTSDDDVVHGNFNQDSLTYGDKNEPKKLIEAEVKDASYDEDILDDKTVTKDELVDAIHKAVKTKDTSTLRDLLDKDERRKNRKQKRMNSWDDNNF